MTAVIPRAPARIAMPAWAVLFSILLAVAHYADARVLLVVVDGLDAREVEADGTPVLARAWWTSRWCPGVESLASMPARTNTNHATLITGVEPEAHGVTGNAVWDRGAGSLRKLGAAADLQAETTFTLARRANRGLRTAAAVAKPKLGTMFAGDGVLQVAPDELWDARAVSDAARDDVTGYAYDGTTLAAARSLVEHAGADFIFVNLADVDRVSHRYGPRSQQAVETRRRTDTALGSFLAWLASRPDWTTTTAFITADHGFDSMREEPLYFGNVFAAAGLRGLTVVGDGGVGHVYLTNPDAPSRVGARLAAARRIALADPGIAEALYMAPNVADGGTRHTIARAHREWHLVHERAGDLLLVAKPGFQIVDGSKTEAKLLGNHGGPGERRVPLIVLGGAPGPTSPQCRDVTAADIGRTVQACLGLPEANRTDGRAIATSARGRVLAGVCPPAGVDSVATVND